ncbi:MAG: phosphopantothenoylcysteine decarboxylase [Bacteroidetes bacterium]|nr:phosphopantothenoylcysteine decarboxylase [Bacteroidota bacterium]
MKVLVTAGPTHEPIDPVRFIGNHSSGKMGIAIAEAFAGIGAEVVMVKGPSHLKAMHPSIQEVEVQTAAEMFQACEQYFSDSDVIVFAAAVADYTPKNQAVEKIKKGKDEWSLELVRTIDIAGELGKNKKLGQFIVGFALETEDELKHAKEKLAKKNFDIIVLNSLKDKGAGFQHDTNKITVIDKAGLVNAFPLKQKSELARDLVRYIMEQMKKTNTGT